MKTHTHIDNRLERGLKLAYALTVLLSVGSYSGLAADHAPTYDLSTPRKALEAVILAEKKGNLASAEATMSKKSLKGMLELVNQMKLKPENLTNPEDPYEKIEVLHEDVVKDRAGLYVKAWYRKDWVQKNKEDETGVENREDGTEVSPDGKTTITTNPLNSPGLIRNLPCEKQGVGYVIYVFVKEGDQWRLSWGLTFRNPIDPMKFAPYRQFLEQAGVGKE